MKTLSYRYIDLVQGEVCVFCKHKQIEESGACAWCASNEVQASKCEVELFKLEPIYE